MRIYVASSWRNALQPAAVAALRSAGHEVYDFRHPAPGNDGFQWRAVDPGWSAWSVERYVEGLAHPTARSGFALDMDALRRCDACALIVPCGRSAHLEAGWAIGAGKRTVVYLPAGEPFEPELMYLMADAIVTTPGSLVEAFRARA